MQGTMMTLAAKTPRIDRTTPRVAARPTASVDRSAFRPVQQARTPTTKPKTAVFKVAGMMSARVRNTRALLQNREIVALPAASSAVRPPIRAEASMITVNNGTASAQAIARGATRVATGSAPVTIRASISSFEHHRAQLGGQTGPHPRRRHQSRKDRADLDENNHRQKAGQRRFGAVRDQQPMGLKPGDDPHREARAHDDRQAFDGNLLELSNHFTESMENGSRD